MPLLEAEANKLSLETLERGVIEEIIDRDDLFALMPFMPIEGKAYLYNRENTISEGAFLDPYEAVPEGAATFTEVTTRLRILAGDVDMDKFLITTQSDSNSQLAIQLASKAKALGRVFRRALITGDNGSNPKSFDGLTVLTPSEQTLIAGANGASVTLSMIDELRDLVKIAGGPDCLMMRRATWRAFKALLRAMNGNNATDIMIEGFGRPVPAIDGLPVILNDFIPDNEVQGSSSVTTSIYALRLNEVDGFHGIVGNNMAGIAVEEIGTIQNKDAVRYRVKWYVGTALKSTLAVARLKGITNI
jgi:HK97 family phage major capsid protein